MWEALRLGLDDIQQAARPGQRMAAAAASPARDDRADQPLSARTVGRHIEGPLAIAVTDDGQILSGGEDATLGLWDPDGAIESSREIGSHRRPIRAVAAVSTGKVVSGTDDGKVTVWDPDVAGDTGREVGRHEGSVRAVATTLSGKVVSGGEDGMLVLSDPNASHADGSELGRLGYVPVEDGIRYGSGDGVISSAERFRLDSAEFADTPGSALHSERYWVLAVAVTRGGKIVSGGGDGLVRLWDPDAAEDAGRVIGRHSPFGAGHRHYCRRQSCVWRRRWSSPALGSQPGRRRWPRTGAGRTLPSVEAVAVPPAMATSSQAVATA